MTILKKVSLGLSAFVIAATLSVTTTVQPTYAATKSVFSSNYNLGVSA